MPDLIPTLGKILIIMYSIILHEVAHGAMAQYLGDDTANREGRLTLNPLPHIDLFGTILLPLLTFKSGFIFGYAKPVPYNPFNVRGKYGELKIALVGPATNFLIAAVFALAMRAGYAGIFPLSDVLITLLVYGVASNIWLALFNLVPIPPLDGSKILFLFIKEENYQLRLILQRYGIFLLIFFLFFGIQIIYPFAQFLIGIFLGSAI